MENTVPKKDIEMLEVVTEDGTTIEIRPRAEIHGNPSLLHKVIHVLVSDGKNGLLLQKRSIKKDVAPGRWDTSVGGHVNPGESIREALIREMEEELGIKPEHPQFLYTYIHSNPYETELVYTFHCIHKGSVRFNRDEIDEVRFWSIDEIRENLGKNYFSDNFEHEFRLYIKGHE